MEMKTKSIKTPMFLIFFAVFIWWLFANLKFIGIGINLFFDILSPFIIGLVIAFILNKPMSFIEHNLFEQIIPPNRLKDKYKRPLSFFITLTLFILVLGILIIIVVPNLIGAGEELAAKLPKYFLNAQNYIKNSSIKYPNINDWILGLNFNQISDKIFSFITRACLKKAFRELRVPVCGRFYPNEDNIYRKLGLADCGNDFSDTL